MKQNKTQLAGTIIQSRNYVKVGPSMITVKDGMKHNKHKLVEKIYRAEIMQ